MHRIARGALVLASIVSIPGCTPNARIVREAPVRSQTPRFATEVDAATGARVLYRLRNGVPDRRTAIRTEVTGWRVGPPPVPRVACYSYHVTEGRTGAVACGMVCTDNRWFAMSCEADIFAGGFDIEYTEQ